MKDNIEEAIKEIELKLQELKDIFEISKNLCECTNSESVKVTYKTLCGRIQHSINSLEWVLKLLK